MQKKLTVLIFIGILLLAAYFRLYGVNWDQDQHLHPDERFLTMVATGISWPKNIFEYLDTNSSPLNPHNRGFGFFVYGTFPVFFTKWIAEALGKGDYNQLTIVGRQLSALFDLGTVILVFLIGKQISNFKFLISNQISKPKSQLGQLENRSIRYFPHLAMFFYAISVLPIQLSHFYAVDTYLTFFITLSFYLLIKIITGKKILTSYFLLLTSLLGLSFGLAIASKISAILIIPTIALFYIFYLIKTRSWYFTLTSGFTFTVFALITVRIAQPYAFTTPNIFNFSLNPGALENWKQLRLMATPDSSFPPAVQWIKTRAYIFPFKNLLFWGFGLPLGILATLSAVFYSAQLIKFSLQVIRKKEFWKLPLQIDNFTIFLILIITIVYTVFSYEGMQFAKAMRYIYPIYPFLSILSALFLTQILQKLTSKYKKIGLLSYWIIGLSVLIYPLSFISIYSRSHSRLQASIWVYQNIPSGSSVSGEHWDDFVPVSLPYSGFIHEKYKGVEFPLYGEDTREKWLLMDQRLKEVDYIILTSNRLYGSIMTVPERYPITFKYYQLLFDNKLGFEKIAEFTSRPNLPIPALKLCLTPPFVRYGIVALKNQECPLSGISFVDDYADETFTVYDHPKVIIFEKVKDIDYLEKLSVK